MFYLPDKQQEVIQEEIKDGNKFASIPFKQDVKNAFHGKPDPFKYLGCFKGKKFDTILSTFNPTMDINKCHLLAKERNYRYFGLMRGHICMASDNLYSMKKGKGCSIKTPGNLNQIGGGNDCSSVFRVKGVMSKKIGSDKYKREENTGLNFNNKDLLMTVKGSPNFAAKYCNSLSKCKYFVTDEDDSRICKLFSDGKKINHHLQTLYIK